MEPISVGSLQERVAMPGQVAVALVISEDEDDVGLLPSVGGGADEGKAEKKQANHWFHRVRAKEKRNDAATQEISCSGGQPLVVDHGTQGYSSLLLNSYVRSNLNLTADWLW
jgi:hypothetical protein